MNYFETVAGHKFADYTIPALVEQLEKLNKKKTRQYCRKCDPGNVYNTMNMELEKGSKFVGAVPDGENEVLVFEMEE